MSTEGRNSFVGQGISTLKTRTVCTIQSTSVTMRQYSTFEVSFAESPVDGTPFQTRASALRSFASIEQASSEMQVTIAHERGPLFPCVDSTCIRRETSEALSQNYANALFVFLGGSNGRSTSSCGPMSRKSWKNAVRRSLPRQRPCCLLTSGIAMSDL